METIIVKIKKESKAAFTKELLKSFDFLEIQEEKKAVHPPAISKKRKTALVQGFKEMKLVEEGKLKAQSGADLLNELKNGKN